MMPDPTVILNLVVAMFLGALIGVERQWRQRFAGLRTNALVALGSSLFVISMGGHLYTEESARLAAQVVSGIGFLGAGVIMREGLTVRGLNTAATLWCAAGIGVLAGFGLYGYAFTGAILVLTANVILRPLARKMNRRPFHDPEEELRYKIRIRCGEQDENQIRLLILQSVSSDQFSLRSIHSKAADDPDLIQVVAEIETHGRKDSEVENIVGRISIEQTVTSVSWHLIEDDPRED